MKPILVGELNPHGLDPRTALFPRPKNGAGYRLCHNVLGLHEADYLRSFERINLCTGKWDAAEAMSREMEIANSPKTTLVLLGKKVAAAFGFSGGTSFRIEGVYDHAAVLLPHPSGLCRVWNDLLSVRAARALLTEVGVLGLPLEEGPERASAPGIRTPPERVRTRSSRTDRPS